MRTHVSSDIVVAALVWIALLGCHPRRAPLFAGMPRDAVAERYDVVVYGGTAAGVIAAVAVAREGKSVALLEPRDHLGGMVSGGLGSTDVGKLEVIGGYAREFFERVGKKYGVMLQAAFEPHVAEAVFHEMVKEARVAVFFRHRLREKGGVTKEGARVSAIALENGATFSAKVFIDATYEGDLMAQSAVAYTWGREGANEYVESLAGVRDKTPLHQFRVPVRARDSSGRLLREIADTTLAPIGSGDKKVQAYNFRVCLTQVAENRVAFPRGYSAERYELLARTLAEMDKMKREKGEEGSGSTVWHQKYDPTYRLRQPWSIKEVMSPYVVPKGKRDTNNQGAFSTDYIGANYEYPDGSYAARERIWREHVEYTQGFLYFLQNDEQVPAGLRAEMASWGLCKDEFTDNGNWPHQLYVREARRMRGEFVMMQRDVQMAVMKPDAIGMGSYQIDSHNVQRVVTTDGYVENEGDVEVPLSAPYQVPYRVMLPKVREAENLIVPVAVSATHVAYGTLRMEPVFMVLGQAAGVAARLAIDKAVSVQSVDTKMLREKLLAQGAVLECCQPAKRP